MGQSFDYWYVIRASNYLCRSHILLASPCVYIHVFISKASLLQSLTRKMCSPWFIHFKISVLRSIQNWVLGSFWIFMIVRASNCWLYAPPALALTVGQYVVIILDITLFYPHTSIHDQWPRLRNSCPIATTLNDTLSTAMMAVPPLWNGPSEVVTWLYPALILLVLNHPHVLLYIFYFMGILLQLLFTSASPTIALPSLVILFFKVSNLCWMD